MQLVTITYLFPFKLVQKCQCCQLCVSRENSNVHEAEIEPDDDCKTYPKYIIVVVAVVVVVST